MAGTTHAGDRPNRHQTNWPGSVSMMTSSNGNIFRETGPLCGEFTGPGEFPTQRPVTRSFDVFFDLRLNKRLNKQSWGWWFETLSRPFWRHRNACKSLRPLRVSSQPMTEHMYDFVNPRSYLLPYNKPLKTNWVNDANLERRIYTMLTKQTKQSEPTNKHWVQDLRITTIHSLPNGCNPLLSISPVRA